MRAQIGYELALMGVQYSVLEWSYWRWDGVRLASAADRRDMCRRGVVVATARRGSWGIRGTLAMPVLESRRRERRC